MESIKARIARSKGPVKAELESLFTELLEKAKKKAAYTANPFTPEFGEEAKAEMNLLAEILGLNTEEDWQPLKEAYQDNKPVRKVS